jgi:hypothetical protein
VTRRERILDCYFVHESPGRPASAQRLRARLPNSIFYARS